MEYNGVVLTVAGSDSGGGAGIQADIKTMTALGCYVASCITTVTAQSTVVVDSIYELTAGAVARQIEVVCSDIQFGAIKIGMLSSVQSVMEVSNTLPKNIPIILDPVMVATSGKNLSGMRAIEALKRHIIPKSIIITPNIFEAEKLIKIKINNLSDMVLAAQKILLLGSQYVLIKGGHLPGDVILNVLMSAQERYIFSHPRITNDELHGIGCSLSSAITCFIAQGLSMNESVRMALKYIIYAISDMPKIGSGYSPICHNRFTLENAINQSLTKVSIANSDID